MVERLATGFGFLVSRLTVFRAHYAIARRYTSRAKAARIAWAFTRSDWSKK